MNTKGNKWDLSWENFRLPFLFLGIFWGLAILLSITADTVFYLFNFGYIGTSIAVGIFLIQALPKEHKAWGRRTSQILVGCYMLFFLGLFGKENMQIEGFFMLLLSGVFAAATMHYVIAKIFGPLVFGRAWCSYTCWTAMVLDLLPHKRPKNKRIKGLGLIRYVYFFLSLGLVLFIWYVLKNPVEPQSTGELYWLIAGNILYYVLGIILALKLKDNRAFCKYICPIPVLQKVTSRFSLLKIKIDPSKCIDCGKCEKVCPMDVNLLAYKNQNQRILATECIWCSTCAYECPENAIASSFGFDVGLKDKLYFRS
ncbi:MAG: 4Fe-4S dicluster domain-containing protein [Peptococcaceae bacterium]|jgi:ferredoxin-type protein NapH|nr:4Fe-4S dicluster domain-containing protein [Peptococcaceae bacterium]